MSSRFGCDCGEGVTYNRPMHRVLAVLLVLMLAWPAVAQTPAPPAAAKPGGPDPEATEQAITVEKQIGDEDIQRRLRKIYDTTDRYSDLGVTVREGIVFMTGSTAQADFKQQATQIARRTEGVVAVVNDLAVTPPALAKLARQEAGDLWRGFVRALPLIGLGLILLVASIIFARLIARLLTYPLRHVTDSLLLRNVVRKVAAILVVLGGIVLFLRVTGLTGVALTVVSGTGLFGLILGFAFRDIAENFLASVILSVQTPFRLGDLLEINGHFGVVDKVSARGTVLVDLDGNHIQIANATVYKASLKNFTANPKMRLHFSIGIGYDASIEEAQRVILDVVRRHSTVLDEPKAAVLVDQLGGSTINLKVYFWIDATVYSLLKVKSSMMRQVVAAVETAGISLPDEAREVIFPQGVPILQSSGGPAGTGDARPARRAAAPASMAEVTEAEGELDTDVPLIKHQAANARNPEEGPDIVSPSRSLPFPPRKG